MKRTSQTACILRLLQAGSSVTAMKALQMFGCARLAARILDLRKQGHVILQTMVESGGKRFASYRLWR